MKITGIQSKEIFYLLIILNERDKKFSQWLKERPEIDTILEEITTHPESMFIEYIFFSY